LRHILGRDDVGEARDFALIFKTARCRLLAVRWRTLQIR